MGWTGRAVQLAGVCCKGHGLSAVDCDAGDDCVACEGVPCMCTTKGMCLDRTLFF